MPPDALSVLQAAESQLRALAMQALKAGEYQEAIRLTDLTRRMGVLIREHMEASPEVSDVPPVREVPSHSGSNAVDVIAQRSRPSSRMRSPKYPRFSREADHLVKIGWSKQAKSEYEHKAPLAAVEALIEKLSSGSARFRMDRVLPLITPSDGREIPDYQAYVALAWLRTTGLVVQHGRRGYSVPDRKNLEKAVKAHWAQLQVT